MVRKNQQNQSAVSDEEIIAALIDSGSIAQAAAKTGISTRTLYDRMGRKDFKAAYSAAKSDIVRQAVFSINSRLMEAIDTITDIMKDKTTPPQTRLQAAKVIIENAARFSERLMAEENYTATMAKGPLSFEF